MAKNYATPGVYINEISALPQSVNEVATAIPAFIGYTAQALQNGKSCINIPVRISSFTEFLSIFCLPDTIPAVAPVKHYSPQYYLLPQNVTTGDDHISLNDTEYVIRPDSATIYYFYNSIRLFYNNGGGIAYIVSVGGYGPPSKTPLIPGSPLVNPNILLNELSKGLATLKKEKEPTMYLCPDATLLSLDDNAALMKEMLQQCREMQTAMAIFDIIGARNPQSQTYLNDISTFRNNTGTEGLGYGAAYYPFVVSNLMQTDDISYLNLFDGDLRQLAVLINPPTQPDPQTTAIFNKIANPPAAALSAAQVHQELLNASKSYQAIIQRLLSIVNTLPPGPAMAGIMTRVDHQSDVWKAPANAPVYGAVGLTINLSDQQQASLNIDPVTGKSVNVIRSFPGRGILVWGARTMAGNDNEWKYISTRRTVTMVQQSCIQAVQSFVFEPNDANTWVRVKSMIDNYLTIIWRSGGLMGSKPQDAFTVSCGLGSTMTANDILNGNLIILVGLSIVHPAEFILFRFQLKMSEKV